MKKFLVVMVVLAMAFISSAALAADVSVGGMIGVRSRDFNTLTYDKDNNAKNNVDTQEKLRLFVNVKSGDDVKGKITIENYWDSFGRFEAPMGNGSTAVNAAGTATAPKATDNQLKIREGWVSFNLPGVPVNVTAGHQLLQLGNGWFFRSMYFGSDAWVVANSTGSNTAAVVDVKIAEGATNLSDDVDAYVLLDVFKLDENNTFGANITFANDRRNALGFNTAGFSTQAQNIEVTYNGKLGPVALKAEADYQMGKAKGATTDRKFKGNQIVIQGNVAVDPVNINFTLARGSGDKKNATDYDGMKTFLDIDTHYTFLYEYKVATAAGAVNTGFANTTAIEAGVSANVAKSVNVGLDIWYLQATEKITNGVGADSSDVGTEADAHVNWKLYDNLTWNWQLAYFKPGAAFKTASGKTDAATGIQGYLIYTF